MILLEYKRQLIQVNLYKRVQFELLFITEYLFILNYLMLSKFIND